MTTNDDPILCPECGQTPTLTKKGWRCGNCFSAGVVLADGYLAVKARYLGMFVGDGAT